MSREIVPHPAGAPSRVSCACQVPAAGAATSAYQKYGGPPSRSRDFAATLPLGASSESSPSSGFSTATITRNGAPFHGATGEGSTASPTASSQVLADAWASRWACAAGGVKNRTQKPPAISDAVTAAAANWRAGTNPRPPLAALDGYRERFRLNQGKFPWAANAHRILPVPRPKNQQ